MGQGTQVLNKTVRFAGFPFGLHFSRFPPHLPPTRPTPGSGRSPCAAPLHLCCSQCSPCALGIPTAATPRSCENRTGRPQFLLCSGNPHVLGEGAIRKFSWREF